MASLYHYYRQWLLQHPVIVTAVVLMVSAVMLAGLPKIQTSDSYRIYFAEDNADLIAVDEFESTFEQFEEIVFVIQAASGDLYTAENLTGLRDLTESSWQLPYTFRVNSISNFRHSEARGDDIFIDPLVPEELDEVITADMAKRARRIALSNEDTVGILAGPEGDATMIMVGVRLPHKDAAAEITLAATEARALMARIEAAYPGLTVHASGRVMLNQHIGEAGVLMQKQFMPLVGVFLIVCLLFFLRSITGTIITMVVVGLSVMGAMGVVGHSGLVLNSVSGAARLIIMTLAVADSVHVLVTFYYLLSKNGGGKTDKVARIQAMQESLRVNFFPVTLTSVTTAIGFLAMNFSDSPPFVDLGNITAFGVLLAWLLSLTLLPALAVLLPASPGQFLLRSQQRMAAFGGWVVANGRVLLLASAAVMLLCMAGLPRNYFGENYAEHFPAGNDFRDAVDLLNDRISTERSINYVLDAGSSNGVYSPAFLTQLDKLVAWTESQPQVHKVTGLHTLLKRLNRTMHGDDPAWFKMPKNRELAAQYLLLYELSLPQGLSLNNLVDVDRRITNITVRLSEATAEDVLNFEQSMADWTSLNMPRGMVSEGLGVAIMFANISERNFRSMILGTFLAVVIISLLMMAALKSWQLGLLSMVPNLIPVLAGFGLWGWFDGRLGMSLAIVGSMTLGIVVDDTVHLLSKYQRARRELGQPAADAIRYAFASTGLALWVTTVALVGAFIIIGTTPFAPVATMMQLACVIIVIALLFDFLFLPPLLLWLSRRTVLSGTKSLTKTTKSSTDLETDSL